MTALRQTVDLSAFPDLVVVYLGMRVNVLTGIKTLLGFGPKIEDSVAAEPDGFSTKISFTRSSRPTLACANIGATLSRLNAGRAQNRIGVGGSDFCGIQAGPASGTNSMPSAAALNRCMSMSSNRLAFFALRPRSRPKAISFRLAIDCAAAECRKHPLHIPKKSSLKMPHGVLTYYSKRQGIPILQKLPNSNPYGVRRFVLYMGCQFGKVALEGRYL